MRNDFNPNYGISALVLGLCAVIVAIVAISAFVLHGEVRGMLDRAPTGSIHVEGEAKGSSPQVKTPPAPGRAH